MKIKFVISLCLVCLFFNVYAEINPTRTKYDNRLKLVDYNPDDVINVFTKVGFTTLIRLSEVETIDKNGGLALGDPEAWNISARGNNIFLRPIADEPDTNLTIVSNKRTYFFNLKTVNSNNSVSWGIKFIYPDDIAANNKKSNKQLCSNSNKINYLYQGKGDKNLIPLKAFDDGQFTCFVMRNNVDIPIVFKKLPDKSEMLVNFHVEGNTIVIHETALEYRIRLGNQVAGVRNNESFESRTNIIGNKNEQK